VTDIFKQNIHQLDAYKSEFALDAKNLEKGRPNIQLRARGLQKLQRKQATKSARAQLG